MVPYHTLPYTKTIAATSLTMTTIGCRSKVNLNFEALGVGTEREREREATRDEIPETVTSFWRQMTRARARPRAPKERGREGDWQELKLPLAQVVRGGEERRGESIILGFCLTHFDQNGRGHRKEGRKEEAKLSCSTHTHTQVTPSSSQELLR